jgi:hypothetical protein
LVHVDVQNEANCFWLDSAEMMIDSHPHSMVLRQKAL